MIKNIVVALQTTILIVIISGCTLDNQSQAEIEEVSSNNQGTNELSLVANGEDFIRQGFLSKDGWQIDFNHAYVTLNEVTAYQTNPPLNVENQEQLQATKSIDLVNQPTTVDLAQGDENAPPVNVIEVIAPTGNYNAIAWSLVNDSQNNASIILDGVAVKEEQRVKFVLKFSPQLNYLCGEFVGDERKGILLPNRPAELETTFHFDHLFGNAQMSPDDELNIGALGFTPLAKIARNNQLDADINTLKKELPPEKFDPLTDNLQHLGHVGEGHCRIEN